MSYYWSHNGLGERVGIHAVSRSGGFGQSWLAREWFDLLAHSTERAVIGSAASMARRSAVQSITVAAGRISGRVLEYNTLYSVEMELPPLSTIAQEMLLDTLAAEPIVAAQVLGSIIPRELFAIDSELQLGLFPASLRDFDIACGCYRWEIPCKHAAAMHLLVAEEFDRDPLLFFVLRGMDRADLLRRLSGGTTITPADALESAVPLSPDPGVFWHGTIPPDEPERVALGPSAPLPPFPFWAGTRPFDAVMAEFLAKAADHASQLAES
ncbi:MAG: hypothetical protein H0X24_14805 [Ktedonobacterales bacterium]|nr:hypothetical protein [Ktedonobacterales bacterium]